MAGLIPPQFIQDLTDRIDLVELVNSRVPLKKAGKNFVACCPFHDEKTPSFNVVSDKQFYHCFGCGAHGDAIEFIKQYDRVDFNEAINTLAQRAGVEVPKTQQADARPQRQRKDLQQVLLTSSQYYEQQLRSHPKREQAVTYLKQRGVDGRTAKQFALGFAPPGWSNLQDYFPDTQQRLLLTTGMLTENDKGRTYDRFRHRIMFPIRNSKGQVIAFGGRVLGDDKPKYLNSPESPLFHKGRELYGLYEAQQSKQKLERFLIVEGYMDVIALAQYGIHYAVATLGTATSADHLARLFRLCDEVVFSFDGDEAGRRAAERALDVVLPLIKTGQQVRFLFLPDGEDPDSWVRQIGKDDFERSMRQATSLADYLLKQPAFQPLDNADNRARLCAFALPKIKKVTDAMYAELLLQQLAQMTGLSLDRLWQQSGLDSPLTKPSAITPPPMDAYTAPDWDDSDIYDNHTPPDPLPDTTENSKVVRIVAEIGYLLCMHPHLSAHSPLDHLAEEPVQTAAEHSALAFLQQLIIWLREQRINDASGLHIALAAQPVPFRERLQRLINREHYLEPDDPEALLADLVASFEKQQLSEEKRQLIDKARAGTLTTNERERLNHLLKIR